MPHALHVRVIVVALLIILAGCFSLLPSHAQQAPPPLANADTFRATTEHRNSTTLPQLPRNLLRDQKFLWLRPFRMKRADVPWAATLLGTTAGLIAIDRPVGQELSDTPPGTGFAFSRRVSQFGGWATDLGVAGTFYLVGRWRNNPRARETGLLAAQAVVDSIIVVEILKTITQRPRPTRADGRLRNHNATGEFFHGGRSFPSGHAIQAWALATVVAEQYRHNPWIRYSAFSLAGLVSLARLTQRKHFPSDIFVGGALGYLIGRYVHHTYAREPPANPADDSAQPRAACHWLPHVCLLTSTGAAVVLYWEF